MSEQWGGATRAACAIHADRDALAACSRCGTFSCEECLSQTPPGDPPLCAACVARTSVSQLPWDYREDVGWLRAWFKSLGPILLRPGVTFSTAKPDGDVGGSLLFSLLGYLMALLPTFGVFALFGAMLPAIAGDSSSTTPAIRAILMGSVAFMAVFVVMIAIFGMVFTIIMAALDHLVMMMFGKPRGFDTTLRGAALSMAPYILGLIPVCGLYIAPLWALVVKIFAYRGLHRMPAGIAVLGALAVPALFFVLGCGLYMIGMFAVMAAGSR
jgi:hypothetical protein